MGKGKYIDPGHYCQPPSKKDQKNWRCGVCGKRFKRSTLIGRLLGKWLQVGD